MKKPTTEQLDSLKKVYQIALKEPNKGVFTHFLQILNDIDSHSVFKADYFIANSLNIKSDMIAIMKSSINYYNTI